MSILTKALVVLVTVLSIVVVALVVPFVATQDNYKSQISDLKGQLSQAQQDAESAQASLKIAQEQESDRNNQLLAQVTQLEKDTDRLENERDDAVTKEQAIRDQLEGLQASYTALSATMQEQKKMIAALTQQVQDSQAEVVDQGKKLLQMADRLDEVTTERNGLVSQVRHLQEQAVALGEELTQYQELLSQVPQEIRDSITGGPSAGAAAAAVPDPPIAGQVTAVEQVGNDLWLVQINVGQTDRVSEGMEFLVHRGDDFKGKLVISRVEPRVAVGKMELVQKDPVSGDQVYAGGY